MILQEDSGRCAPLILCPLANRAWHCAPIVPGQYKGVHLAVRPVRIILPNKGPKSATVDFSMRSCYVITQCEPCIQSSDCLARFTPRKEQTASQSERLSPPGRPPTFSTPCQGIYVTVKEKSSCENYRDDQFRLKFELVNTFNGYYCIQAYWLVSR